IERLAAERIVFSLDAKAGIPLASAAWQSADLWTIWQKAILQGVARVLVLDLAAVGKNEGSYTEGLCERLRSSHPRLEISTGGGVRGADDLRRLAQLGLANVLVASALHDGRLAQADLREFI